MTRQFDLGGGFIALVKEKQDQARREAERLAAGHDAVRLGRATRVLHMRREHRAAPPQISRAWNRLWRIRAGILRRHGLPVPIY